ncbi:MAG: hypothetical protein K2Q26_16020 [Bdellovibrionales bacterium]|nr:hypothetical protein [Bdellovibrionales bacterium]
MRSFVICGILMGILLACDKKDQSQNWGPEVAVEEILKAQTEALALLDVQKIQKGEFAYFIKSQELFSSQLPSSLLIEEEAITVVEREDFEDYFSITTVREVVDHLAEGKPTYKYKDVYGILKNPEPPPDEVEEPQPVEDGDEPTSSVKVTFHNLRVTKIMVPRPLKVEEREPCPVANACDLEATQILYDIVVQEAGKETQKNQAELVLSDKVPFFAGVLRSCVTTVAAIDDARPFVRQCKSIYDYL